MPGLHERFNLMATLEEILAADDDDREFSLMRDAARLAIETCATICDANAELQRIRAKAEGNEYAAERAVEASKCARMIRERAA
jgi:hypothetical protein